MKKAKIIAEVHSFDALAKWNRKRNSKTPASAQTHGLKKAAQAAKPPRSK